MPNRDQQRRPVRSSEDETPLERIERPAPFDPAQASFASFRSKFGAEGAMVKVYRRTVTNQMLYCFQDIPSRIDEEVVRAFHAKQPYAAEQGDYYARLFVNGEPMEEPIAIPIAPQAGVVTHENGGMAQTNGGGRLEMMLERIAQRLESVERGDREPLSSLADAMVKIQQLAPKQETSLDQVIKAIELGKTIGGGATPDADDWKPLIRELLVGAAPLLQGMAAAYLRRPAAPGQGQPPGTETTDVQILNDQQRMFALIQYLKAKCLKGSDPFLYVDLLLNDADEPDNQKLIHAIVTQEFENFVAIDAEIGRPPFLAWFRAIYDGLRSQVEAANKMAADPLQQGRDESDTSKNGKSGKGRGGNKKQ